jgi:hypothetical protein
MHWLDAGTCCPANTKVLTQIRDAGLERRQLVLLACAVLPPGEISFPRRSELINLMQALKCDCPTIFLDLDLGEMLLRTDLLPHFSTDDVNWPWPGLRIMLPKELTLSADTTQSCPLQYVDVCLAAQNEPIRFPQ